MVIIMVVEVAMTIIELVTSVASLGKIHCKYFSNVGVKYNIN